MKSETFMVQGNHHIQQVITCGIIDQLFANLPISVVFFYKESVECNILTDSLKIVLSDFSIFAGRLKKINNNLCIDANNQGIIFSITKDDCSLDHVIEELPKIKKERLVNLINPQKVISNQSPVMTIKLTYFACGGMSLGISWHHSIGDMHTFMQLMQAWSNTVNGNKYIAPLIVEERDLYLQEKLKENNNTIPSVRYLSIKELFKLIFYIFSSGQNKFLLQFYFSKNELNNIKQAFLENTQKSLSINDVLCSHLSSIISEVDQYHKERYLSIIINYRSRIELPENLLGNFISTINVAASDTVNVFQIAKDLRESINNFQELNMNFFSTQKYIEEKGGTKKINRFVSEGINPLKRTLFITSWVNFGIYDIIFGQSKPFYFSYFGEPPFPWISAITEEFSNNGGLIYSAYLPSKLAKNLKQNENLQKIHKYRNQKEVIPELVRKLEWLY
ncbi:MAG: vinorine synthase [Microcystis aeruginosa BS13-10]|jgi:shikimate O-hydroxycinnamoyltransferase|uniref:Vinorine synthase n=1 Tax=Microcystis aeruginosa G11-04 TaxID=2685956 RepID=A0A966FXL8_MICAE|nr:vinorine synthase [Microcystis aeruginosa BS13-10]NCS56532.1 vinorine synthase [Microcystis aeruginosa G11-04]NCT41945.1 vinorine synthase [Microcystis aeruginosa G11-09]